jgi:hypothetical protein
VFSVLGWPGGDLLSRALRHSTIGAEAVNDRVRDGIGSGHLATATRPAKDRWGRIANGEWRIEKFHSPFAIRHSPFAFLQLVFRPWLRALEPLGIKE